MIVEVITTTIIFILIISGLILILKRNIEIVSDTGLIRHLILLIGLLSYFISNYFICKENWTQSCFSFIFKHSGIVIIYIVFSFSINLADVFGIANKEFEIKQSSTFNSSFRNQINSYLFDVNSNIKDRKSSIGKSIAATSKNELNAMKSELRIKKVVDNLKKNSEFIIKSIFYYIFVLLVIIGIIIYYGYIKDEKGKIVFGQNTYHYESALESKERIFDIIEFFIFTMQLGKLKITVNYELIFYHIKLIFISVIVIITLGPAMNVSF